MLAQATLSDSYTLRKQLRALVRGAYDIQKLRTQYGGRLVSNFKVKLGLPPAHSERELSKESRELLDRLKANYRILTDGVAKFTPSLVTDDCIISTHSEFDLVAGYLEAEEAENRQFRRVKDMLPQFTLYERYLRDVVGIGHYMAGVILSEIDITKCRYPSSMWKYAGLDVVQQWTLCGLEWEHCVLGEDMKAEITAQIPAERPLADQDGRVLGEPTFGPQYTSLHMRHSGEGFQVVAEYELSGDGLGRSRRKDHLILVDYTDKEGNKKKRWSITFNPFLKTKLVAVLGPSFLKKKNERYCDIYYNYHHRLEQHATYGGTAKGQKGRRYRMSLRYMIKRFLADLYVEWRTMEGLPVEPPYQEAKLGHVHQEVETPMIPETSYDEDGGMEDMD
jgi:hypothetical protein